MKSRTWFITGASRGIGAETVEAALAAGDRVAATGRSVAAMQDRFGERDGLHFISLDVSDASAIAGAVEDAIAHFGQIDILLNNAGYGMLGTLEETTAEEFRDCVETNFFGTVFVCKAVIPHMRERRAGHIVNVTSAGGFSTVEGFSAYCAAKFAVEGLTDTLRRELSPFGIRVTAVEPGYVRSDFGKDTSLVTVPKVIPDYQNTGAIREAMGSGQVGQPGDPVKVAQAIVKMTQSDDPPRWLPLGKDAVQIIETKLAEVQHDIDLWRDLASSTYFENEQK